METRPYVLFPFSVCVFFLFCYNGTKTRDYMRLDKFLKVSRIIKRRTVASEACDKQRQPRQGRQGSENRRRAGDSFRVEHA
jgi:hypothetical protein